MSNSINYSLLITQPPPQQVRELLSGAQADSLQAAAGDTTAIERVSQDLSQATQLLLDGEWGALVSQVYHNLIDLFVRSVPDLIAALLVLLFLYGIYRAVGHVLHRLLDRSRRVDAGLYGLLIKTYRVVALMLIAVIVLGQLGFDITALIAGLSIAGIALGFAARDSLENFISGVTILLDRPFRVGDNIEVKDTFGTVEEITLRSTRLRTLNSEIAVMPNTQMIQEKLINHTMLGTIRIFIPFGIGYDESPQKARAVLLDLLEGDERLHPDHPPKVVVMGLGASSVDMQLRMYLRNPKLEVPIRFEYIEKVFEALTEANIEIPFPHLQLFIDEAKAFHDSYLLQPHPPSDGASSPPDGPEAPE